MRRSKLATTGPGRDEASISSRASSRRSTTLKTSAFSNSSASRDGSIMSSANSASEAICARSSRARR